jgi:hypothetical protein
VVEVGLGDQLSNVIGAHYSSFNPKLPLRLHDLFYLCNILLLGQNDVTHLLESTGIAELVVKLREKLDRSSG